MSIEPCIRSTTIPCNAICTEPWLDKAYTTVGMSATKTSMAQASSHLHRLVFVHNHDNGWPQNLTGPESGWPLHLAAAGRAACDLSCACACGL
ncbi:hypothetical protein M441DRAFT_457073, partial [Trichoderma asperellum CBS 433.97]